MELYLHFLKMNSEFNQGLADDLHGGEETEDNIRCLWEDELKVSEPVREFKIRNNAAYTLAGFYPDDQPFSFEIWDMTVVDCTTEGGKQMQFAVSKKLLKKTEKKVDADTGDTHLYFFLRDSPALENPMDGVYIVRTDFPKELRKKTT